MPDFLIESFHSANDKIVVGIDEAGRGPWAGPVVAAAAYIKSPDIPFLSQLNDSKKLSKKKREELYTHIIDHLDYGIGIASPEEIDDINILQATFLAMRRAVETMQIALPDVTIIDGKHMPKWPDVEIVPVTKGDQKSYSIAAASILAKVTRDRIMTEASKQYPQYLWHKNSGYGTKDHIQALSEFGVTPLHRKSFAPIRRILENQ